MKNKQTSSSFGNVVTASAVVLLALSLCCLGCCKPNCINKCCGDDGCGGTCPNICDDVCKSPYKYCDRSTCNCKDADCYPDCLGRCCGSDNCCGSCSIECPIGYHCNKDTCACEYGERNSNCFLLEKKCGVWTDDDGNRIDCGFCPNNELCNDGNCETCKSWTCEMLGIVCGDWDDDCGGTVSCGECSPEEECNHLGKCRLCSLSELGQPCPYSHVHYGACDCAVGLECIGDSYIDTCSFGSACDNIPEIYNPDCHARNCGYSFCSVSCEVEQCPAGFVEDTSLGSCYCFPE